MSNSQKNNGEKLEHNPLMPSQSFAVWDVASSPGHTPLLKEQSFDGLATLATKTVASKNVCIYDYAFNVTSVSLFCVCHAEPRDMRAAISLGPHVFVRCLRQFLWRVLPGPLSMHIEPYFCSDVINPQFECTL